MQLDLPRLAAAGCAVCAALALAGCAGSIDRDSFESVVSSRGGGATSDLATEAFAALTHELNVEDPELMSILVLPPIQRTYLEVLNPMDPDEADTYELSGGDLSEPEPIQLGPEEMEDRATFRPSEVPALLRLEQLADEALAEFADADGRFVASISVSGDSVPLVIVVSVDALRERGTVTFTPDGSLVEVVRR